MGKNLNKLYEQVLNDYIFWRTSNTDNVLCACHKLKGKDLIRTAAKSIGCDNKLHLHQHRVGEDKCADFANFLYKQKNIINDLEGFDNFDAIYLYIKNLAKEFNDQINVKKPTKGIGKLTVYDVSLRIALNFYSKPIEPSYVYIHRGTKDGAVALFKHYKSQNGCKVSLKSKMPIYLFPEPFRRHKEWYIENLLCIYKESFQKKKFIPNKIRG